MANWNDSSQNEKWEKQRRERQEFKNMTRREKAIYKKEAQSNVATGFKIAFGVILALLLIPFLLTLCTAAVVGGS